MDLLAARRLVDAQAGARAGLTRRVIEAVLGQFRRFDGWYTDRLVVEVCEQVAAIVLSGSRGVAAVTDAYLARVASLMVETSIAPAGVNLTETLRIGVTLPDVYERVARQYRYQQSLGAPPAAALDHALGRAEVMVDEDLSLAHREQARRFMAARRVDDYRRVIRPEMSKSGETCGLCVVASDRIYHSSDLMPIHARCNCETLPIIGSVDPGRSLNQDELDALYNAAGGTTSGRALKRLRVRVTEHGELGPVLENASHRRRTRREADHERRAA